MWEDPIVADIHRIRERLAERFHFDVHAIFQDMRERQDAVGVRLVREPKVSNAEPVEAVEQPVRASMAQPVVLVENS